MEKKKRASDEDSDRDIDDILSGRWESVGSVTGKEGYEFLTRLFTKEGDDLFHIMSLGKSISDELDRLYYNVADNSEIKGMFVRRLITNLQTTKNRIITEYGEGIKQNGGLEDGDPTYGPIGTIFSIEKNLERCERELKLYILPAADSTADKTADNELPRYFDNWPKKRQVLFDKKIIKPEGDHYKYIGKDNDGIGYSDFANILYELANDYAKDKKSGRKAKVVRVILRYFKDEDDNPLNEGTIRIHFRVPKKGLSPKATGLLKKIK